MNVNLLFIKLSHMFCFICDVLFIFYDFLYVTISCTLETFKITLQVVCTQLNFNKCICSLLFGWSTISDP